MGESNIVAVCMTGAFGELGRITDLLGRIASKGELDLMPILSYNAAETDTGSGSARDFRQRLMRATGNSPLVRMEDTASFMTHSRVKLLVVAPCTSDTLFALANGIASSPVSLAASIQAGLGRPLLIAPFTRFSMPNALMNIAKLMATGAFVAPFAQDSSGTGKGLHASYETLETAFYNAIAGKQTTPIFRESAFPGDEQAAD